MNSLGAKTEDEPGINKALSVLWDVIRDDLQFNISDVISGLEDLQPTKRGFASATVQFFNPLGLITIPLCQELIKTKIGWDETLSGSLVEK